MDGGVFFGKQLIFIYFFTRRRGDAEKNLPPRLRVAIHSNTTWVARIRGP
jgi:hypothetical protein